MDMFLASKLRFYFTFDFNFNQFFVLRRFRRRVTIPKGVNPESVTSTMSPQGILTILAPKMMLEGSSSNVI